MKCKQNKVVQLVNALTPNEKQYFKKNYGGDYDFIRLFDFINKQHSLNSKAAIAYLNKLNTSSKKITSGYLSVIKKYLLEKLTDSLRQQRIAAKPHLGALLHAINSDILLDKGLPDLAKIELAQAKQKTTAGLFEIEQIYLHRKRVILNFYESYEGMDLKELIDICDERIQLTQQAHLVAQLGKVFSTINYLNLKGLDKQKYLETCRTNPLLKDVSLFKSVRSKHLFYWVKALIGDHSNDGGTAIHYYQKAIQVWLDHPDYIKIHLRYYFGLCFTFLGSVLKFKFFNKPTFNVQLLAKMFSVIDRAELVEDEKAFYDQYMLLFQLNSLEIFRQHAKILELIPVIKKLVESEKPIFPFIRITFHFYSAKALHLEGQHTKALDWLHPLVDTQEIKLAHNADFIADTLILYLLIHFDLGNYQFLKNQIKKKQQLIQKYGRLDPLRTYFLQQLQKLVKQKLTTKNKFDFTQALEKLKKIELDPTFNHATYHLISFGGWFKSKNLTLQTQ